MRAPKTRIVAALAIFACLRRRVAAEPAASSEGPPAAAETLAPTVSSREAFANALRLAQALHDDAVLARLRAAVATRPRASKADLEAMIAAFEAIGEPDRAARLLRTRIAQHEDAGTSGPLLAELLSRAGRAREAADAWRAVRALRGAEGLTAEEADTYARVLSRLGRFEQAFETLAEASPRARSDDVTFFSDLGALAWQLGRDPEAREAYNKLWRNGSRRDEIIHRLLVLGRAAGDPHGITELAWEHFRTSHDAEMLLEVAAQQLERGDFRALRRSLDLAEPYQHLFAGRTAYWTLRAECAAHEHNLPEAARDWERALDLEPASPSANLQAEVLWSAIDAGSLVQLKRVVARIDASGAPGPVVWAPLALAYRRIGRPHDAARLWARQRQAHPALDATAFDLADALEQEGFAAAAWRLAGAAAKANLSETKIREAGATSAEDAAGGDAVAVERRQLLARSAEVLGQRRGPDLADRWLARTGAPVPRAPGRWVRWCLDQDAHPCAARVLADPHASDGAREAEARRWSLARAIEDGDRTVMREALAELPGDEPELRTATALALHEDVTPAAPNRGEAGQGVGDTIAATSFRRGEAGEVEERASAAEGREGDRVEDPGDWRAPLRLMREGRMARVGAGLTYEDVADLSAVGPDASGLLPLGLGDARLALALGARDLSAPAATLRLKPYTAEVDGLAVARLEDRGNLTELGAGASFNPFGTLPRGLVSHQRWLIPQALLTLRGAANEAIEDGALLHIAAAQSQATASVLVEAGPIYADLGAHVRDDRTRRWTELGREVADDGELGVRILRALPELDLGVRFHAQRRWNVAHLPVELLPPLPLGATAGANGRPLAAPYLPGTFQFVALTLHLVRGELGERHRPDGTPWPRYACGIEAGVRLPRREGAAGGQCALGLRVGADGVLEAAGAYGRGLVGFAHVASARASLSYTLRF